MSRIRNLVNRLLSRGAAPSEASPSLFNAEVRQNDIDSTNDYEMQMAIERERARRSAM